MKHSLWLFLAAVTVACSTREPLPTAPPNRWADERLWPVLEAQEHRNVDALCALLNDTAEYVRGAAALAFASVQDSAAIPCLMAVLQDSSVEVRSHAVFALGYIANDSIVDRMALLSDGERDSTVIRAYHAALFLNLQRRGRIDRSTVPLTHFARSVGHERVRAADALRRLPAKLLWADSAAIRSLVQAEDDPEVRALLIAMAAQLDAPWARALNRHTLDSDRPAVERIAALRAMLLLKEGLPNDTLVAYATDPDPVLASAARALLMDRSPASAQEALRWLALLTTDSASVMGSPAREIEALEALRARTLADPYHEATRIRLLAAVTDGLSDEALESILFAGGPAVVRQAAFSAVAQRSLLRLRMHRAITPDMQAREEAALWERVLRSGDAGILCAAAEQLGSLGASQLRVLLPDTLCTTARATLHPLRDLEAQLLLDGLVAKRDDQTVETPPAPRYNHPIDKVRLQGLKQGQRYRISTAKGSIVIATDVNECPGSSLAFDSLVTAGYYNDKSFHRMVPNFVLQGGCPRGDGYGGMPWTLRTEIGRTPFKAGSVGLASAGRDTESCQFFITHVATPHLDGRYTRFGEVVEGMDVVHRLAVGDVMQRVERVER